MSDVAISGAIMKIKSARREEVLGELEKISGVSFQQETNDGELILLIETKNIETLHKTCLRLEKLDGVLGFYPSYVTTADEI